MHQKLLHLKITIRADCVNCKIAVEHNALDVGHRKDDVIADYDKRKIRAKYILLNV